MAPTETALIVPVLAAQAVVGGYRAKLDHSAAWGVPAHVTVLYPFVPPDDVTDAVVARVRACVTTVPAFSCAFAELAWFGADVVWLAPDPAAPFRALTERVMREFPDCLPYGGEHPDPVPHLTVGSTRAADLDALRRAAAAVASRLPVHATIDRVQLLAGSDRPGGWHCVAEFPLGTRR